MPFRRTGLYKLAERIGMWMSERIEVDGLWVGVFAEPDDDALLARVRDALGLIAAHDPYRHRLIRREMDRIWIHLLPGDNSDWVAEERHCTLDPRVVRQQALDELAAMVIHEAVRARIERRGVTRHDYVRRQEIDRACLRQELAFARRVPDGAALITSIGARMLRPAEFWAARSLRQRQAQGEVELMAYADVPGWAMRTAMAVRRVRAWMRR